MNKAFHRKFIYQYETLLFRFKSERRDLQNNRQALITERISRLVNLPNLPNEQFRLNLAALERIKKEIERTEKDLTRVSDNITDIEFEIENLKKK